jgi:hypothetical protein
MARTGFSEDLLIAVGRWSSKSYLDYVKLGLTHRAMFSREVAKGV